MSRAARIALFAGALALTALAGGAGLLVRAKTKVSPDAMRSSVTLDRSRGRKACEVVPTASTSKGARRGSQNASLYSPASVANALRILGRDGHLGAAALARNQPLLSGICFLELTLDELRRSHAFEPIAAFSVLQVISPGQFQQHLQHCQRIRGPLHRRFQPQGSLRSRGRPPLPISGWLSKTRT